MELQVHERALAAYLGLAIGDALGATTEFMLPGEIKAKFGIHKDITGGGWLRLKPGQVTDDTTMALALGDAIIRAGGMDRKVVADSFVEWMRSKPVDIGSTVRTGIRRYITDGSLEAPPSEYSSGNGAAMRNLAVALATLDCEKDFRDCSLRQAHITHNDPDSDAGTLILGDLTRKAVLMGQSAPLHTSAAKWFDSHPKFDYRHFRPIDSDGYIVHTVRTVLFYFFNTSDFESCLLGIVNLGGDADTNGALAGQLSGAFYGLESIPSRWLKKLDPGVREAIERQVGQLVAMFPML